MKKPTKSIKSIASCLRASTLDQLGEAEVPISTGCLVIDCLLKGGLPGGLITEVVGDYSTGKTLLALQVCREVINAGGMGVYLDSENALNRDWAVKTLGVNPASLICPLTGSLEDGYDVIQKACKIVAEAGVKPSIIVWDSIAATPPAVIRKDEKGSRMAVAARINSERMPLLLEPVHQSGTILLILNQLRSKIGTLYGQKWESCGGRAIRFYSSLRLHVTRRSKEKTDGRVTGTIGRIEIIKSRWCQPFTKVDFEIDFKRGIPPWSGLLALLKKAGLLEASGGRYRLKGKKTSFTKAQLPELYEKLWAQVDQDKIEQAIMET